MHYIPRFPINSPTPAVMSGRDEKSRVCNDSVPWETKSCSSDDRTFCLRLLIIWVGFWGGLKTWGSTVASVGRGGADGSGNCDRGVNSTGGLAGVCCPGCDRLLLRRHKKTPQAIRIINNNITPTEQQKRRKVKYNVVLLHYLMKS